MDLREEHGSYRQQCLSSTDSPFSVPIRSQYEELSFRREKKKIAGSELGGSATLFGCVFAEQCHGDSK